MKQSNKIKRTLNTLYICTKITVFIFCPKNVDIETVQKSKTSYCSFQRKIIKYNCNIDKLSNNSYSKDLILFSDVQIKTIHNVL